MVVGYPVLNPYQIYADFYAQNSTPVAFLGPSESWQDVRHANIYLSTMAGHIRNMGAYDPSAPSEDISSKPEYILGTRSFVPRLEDMVEAITNAPGDQYAGFQGFGIFTPTNGASTIFFSDNGGIQSNSGGPASIMNLVTTNIINANSNGTIRQISAGLRSFVCVSLLSSPFVLTVTLAKSRDVL